MTSAVKFGTSGWRDVIADQFTFANLRLACHAIAETLTETGLGKRGIVIGYDTRFLSEQFAAEAARILATHDIRCVVSDRGIPTPAVSHAVRHGGFGGAINITASHNPAHYNGLKLATEQGAPSPVALSRMVETKAARIALSADVDTLTAPPPTSQLPPEIAARISKADFREPYFTQIEKLVNLDAIAAAKIKLAVDLRWGVALGWLDELLRRHGIQHTVIHDHRDVTFGGGGPDVSEKYLRELASTVIGGGYTLGVACDGDADRFGVVDADGTWISPNLLLALLADYLADTRGFRQGLGRTYATTGLIDSVAKHYGVAVHQTPVGFKYLGELMLENKVFLAGAESAGMSMIGHVPEKDGLLAVLLAAEMVAVKGASIGKLREALFAKVGALYSRREDCRVAPEQTERLRALMKTPPTMLGSRKVARTTVLDGLRLDFDDGAWLLMRPSGTEPVVRYYAEAPAERDLEDLMKTGKTVLIGGPS